MNELSIIAALFWILLVGGIFYLFVFRRRTAEGSIGKKLFHATKEEAASESLLFLSVLFAGVALLSFNNDLHQPVSWRTILLVTTVLAFFYAYLFRITSPLMLGMAGLVFWWMFQTLEWAHGARVTPSASIAGVVTISLLSYVSGRLHEGQKNVGIFSPTYLGIGIILISVILFFFSTSSGLEFLQDMTFGNRFRFREVIAALSILVAVLIISLLYSLVTKRLGVGEVIVLIFLLALFVTITFLPMQEVFLVDRHLKSVLNGRGVFWAIVFNVLSFLELLGLILLGYRRRTEWLVNTGALLLSLFIIVKYVDWFFKFLDKSLFFIGAGVLMFFVGWLMERARRYMLSSFERVG